MNSRPAAVAGTFYPEEVDVLTAGLHQLMLAAPPRANCPKVLVVPHAAYVYSGYTAACAYQCLRNIRSQINRVVLIGPAHRLAFDGIALPTQDSFATPLGAVKLDQEALSNLTQLPAVLYLDQAHAAEHSLEVQLPFLQLLLSSFQLLPILVGQATPQQVANVLNQVWGGDETLIVVSTDLSHFHTYQQAQQCDQATLDSILQLQPNLSATQACGYKPMNGLMLVAQQKGLQIELLDSRNSGDCRGDKQRVVGYAAFALA